MGTLFSSSKVSSKNQQSLDKSPAHRTFWSARIFATLIELYRWIFKPLMIALGGVGFGCRYHPSCSHYAVEAVGEWGIWKGSWMGLFRVFRCNPWLSRDSWDPVPQRKSKLRVSVG